MTNSQKKLQENLQNSTLNDYLIQELIKITNRSPLKRHMVGCILVSNNKIISNGWAHIGQYRLAEVNSMHSELHALGRGRHRNMKGATAFVMARARKSGNITFGRPCLCCSIALKSAGVEKVFYSTSGNSFKCLNLEDDLSKLKVYIKGTNG
jgi:deoxycytidylate deaminase